MNGEETPRMDSPKSFVVASDADLHRARWLLRACACILLFASLYGIRSIHEACGAVEAAVRPVLYKVPEGETRTLEIDASPVLVFPGLSGGFLATIEGGRVADRSRGIREVKPELRLTHRDSDRTPVLPGDVATRYGAFLVLACIAGLAEALARCPDVGAWRGVVFLSLVPYLLFTAPVLLCLLLVIG